MIINCMHSRRSAMKSGQSRRMICIRFLVDYKKKESTIIQATSVYCRGI